MRLPPNQQTGTLLPQRHSRPGRSNANRVTGPTACRGGCCRAAPRVRARRRTARACRCASTAPASRCTLLRPNPLVSGTRTAILSIPSRDQACSCSPISASSRGETAIRSQRDSTVSARIAGRYASTNRSAMVKCSGRHDFRVSKTATAGHNRHIDSAKIDVRFVRTLGWLCSWCVLWLTAAECHSTGRWMIQCPAAKATSTTVRT